METDHGEHIYMDLRTFMYNFKNVPSYDGRPRQKTFLCYEVYIQDYNSKVPLNSIRGFLCNQYHPDPQLRCHAELCFLDWISSWKLYPGQECWVTWFLSWSPCPDCAWKVANFLKRNRHVHLCISAARIYDCQPGYEEGLRSLWDAGADITIMTYRDFEYCWRAFVDNNLRYFNPWYNLEENSQIISEMLQDIL